MFQTWPLLYPIQYGSAHMLACFILPNCERVPLVTMSHSHKSFIWFVSLLYLLFCSSLEAHWMNLLWLFSLCIFLYDSFYFFLTRLDLTCACLYFFSPLFSLYHSGWREIKCWAGLNMLDAHLNSWALLPISRKQQSQPMCRKLHVWGWECVQNTWK